MKSLKPGKDILVSVENITPFGIWLYVKEKEYFLSYEDYPYFQEKTIKSIQKVQLLHAYHLYWSELDVDLGLDNLENPQKYPYNLIQTFTEHLKSANGLQPDADNWDGARAWKGLRLGNDEPAARVPSSFTNSNASLQKSFQQQNRSGKTP